MISNPQKYAGDFRKAGSDWITFHIEAKGEPKDTIRLIKSLGVKVGIAVDAQTPVENILPYLSEVDLALAMSVRAGFSGQKFMPSALDKLDKIKAMKDKEGLDLLIGIDGGIGPSNAKLVKEHGAEMLVAGSAIYGAKDPAAAIKAMKDA